MSKTYWPGLDKWYEKTMKIEQEIGPLALKEYWLHKKAEQLNKHNGTETRMTIGHGETLAVINCKEGFLYFKGIPREYL